MALLNSTTVAVVGLGLVIAALFVARREQRLARSQAALRLRAGLPAAVVVVAFLGMLAGWC